jgi:hypothetical protein
MRKLEEYSPSTPMTDDFKLRLIKNAVSAAPHLATIESTQEINERMGSFNAGALSFNGYMEVLISAAQNYDNTVAPTTRSATRRAHWHATFCNDSNPDEGYDIDTPIDTIVANAHDIWIAQHRNLVSDDAWSKLPSSSRDAWISIPMADRKVDPRDCQLHLRHYRHLLSLQG